MEKKFNSTKSQIKNVNFGANCQIVEPVNIYNCKIGKNVFIGPFVEIQKNSDIGDFTKISSHSFICEAVSIGKNCFIGHGVMFTNFLFSDGRKDNGKNNWLKTEIENDVLIGSNATILPIKICSGVVIGAGAVVTKDIFIKGTYAGNPAKLIKKL